MKHKTLLFAFLLILVFACSSAPAQENSSLPKQPVYSPEQALALLHEGNQRFVKGNSVYPNQTSHQRIITTIQGQKPFATIISSSDSRVVPALIFDRGIGDLYVVRILGSVAGTDTLASIEYSMTSLKTPLLVVLGNTHSAIIKAAIEGKSIKGHLAQLIGKLEPAIKMTRTLYPQIKGKELLAKTVETNVRQVLHDILGQCPQILKKMRTGEIQVLGAVYDVDTGKVNWIGP